MEDWILQNSDLEGRMVSVLRDVSAARFYFKNQREMSHIDEHAVASECHTH
jgi:hypothetical protein